MAAVVVASEIGRSARKTKPSTSAGPACADALLKRKFCMYQLQGICRKSSEECPFAHSMEEMEQSRSKGKKKAGSPEPSSASSPGSSSDDAPTVVPPQHVPPGSAATCPALAGATTSAQATRDVLPEPEPAPEPAGNALAASSPLAAVDAAASKQGVMWPRPPPGLEEYDMPGMSATEALKLGQVQSFAMPLQTPAPTPGVQAHSGVAAHRVARRFRSEPQPWEVQVGRPRLLAPVAGTQLAYTQQDLTNFHALLQERSWWQPAYANEAPLQQRSLSELVNSIDSISCAINSMADKMGHQHHAPPGPEMCRLQPPVFGDNLGFRLEGA